MEHVSVLKNEVREYLGLKVGEVVVDCTLGLGGHSLDILEKIGKSGKLIAFEEDEKNLKEAKKRLKKYESQIIFFHDNFRHLKNRIAGKYAIDAVLFDLGLSSPHVDDPERGFSFSKDGPLDMRFNKKNPLTAAEVINEYEEEALAKIFFEYGEEKMGRKVARRICEQRRDKKFSSTGEFVSFLEATMTNKSSKRSSKTHPATKIFQALRIEVNDELSALREALDQAFEVLKVGGRIVVMSYHSLEDRIVKRFFKELERPKATKEESIYRNFGEPFVRALTKKPVIPLEKEIIENPRSRSAKLRAYEKIKEA